MFNSRLTKIFVKVYSKTLRMSRYREQYDTPLKTPNKSSKP